MEKVRVLSMDRKLVIVEGEEYLCDIIRQGKTAKVRGENLSTGEIIDWITVDDGINAAFRFGDYLLENKK